MDYYKEIESFMDEIPNISKFAINLVINLFLINSMDYPVSNEYKNCKARIIGQIKKVIMLL